MVTGGGGGGGGSGAVVVGVGVVVGAAVVGGTGTSLAWSFSSLDVGQGGNMVTGGQTIGGRV